MVCSGKILLKEVKKMTEQQMKLKLIENADNIVRALKTGKDIMITTNATGISIKKLSVSKI